MTGDEGSPTVGQAGTAASSTSGLDSFGGEIGRGQARTIRARWVRSRTVSRATIATTLPTASPLTMAVAPTESLRSVTRLAVKNGERVKAGAPLIRTEVIFTKGPGLGNPRDYLPPDGIDRHYATDDSWREQFAARARRQVFVRDGLLEDPPAHDSWHDRSLRAGRPQGLIPDEEQIRPAPFPDASVGRREERLVRASSATSEATSSTSCRR